MHYWIDGYNLLFRLTKNYQQMKKNERPLLMALQQSMALLKYQATLVFDGKDKTSSEFLRKNLDSLALIYTPYHQTADDYILEEIATSRDISNEVVVSSDLELLRKARQKGAQGVTVEKFLSQMMQKKKKRSPPPKKEVQETDFQLRRLCKIFEERLKEEKNT